MPDYDQAQCHFSMMNETAVELVRRMQLDTLLASLRLAELGVEVALAHSSMVEDALAEGRLVELLSERFCASESFYLVRRSTHELPQQAAVFVDWLESLRAS